MNRAIKNVLVFSTAIGIEAFLLSGQNNIYQNIFILAIIYLVAYFHGWGNEKSDTLQILESERTTIVNELENKKLTEEVQGKLRPQRFLLDELIKKINFRD